MNTKNNPTLLLALTLIGATTFILGGTANISRMTMTNIDPTSGSGEILIETIQEELEVTSEEYTDALTDEVGEDEVVMEDNEVIEEEVPVDITEEIITEEESTSEETAATGSGNVLEMLQELYSSARAIPAGMFGITSPKGTPQDQQHNLAEYVFQQMIAESYKESLRKEVAQRTTYTTQVIDYANLTEEVRNSTIIRKEDHDRLRVRAEQQTVVHRTTASGSTLTLEAEKFLLSPYTNIGEQDVLHVGLRAMSELRALLGIPGDSVSIYLSEESARANTNGLSLASGQYSFTNQVWTVRYQLYYQGKEVRHAEVIIRMHKNGSILSATSTLPALDPFVVPAPKEVFYDTVRTDISTIFPQFDSSKDTIEEIRDIFIFHKETVYPALEMRVRTHNPFGEWIVVINATDGEFISKYNLYQFGEEETAVETEEEDKEEDTQGVPHQAWLMHLANSVQDTPAYTVQTKQWVRLSSMVAPFATEVDGIFYPTHASTTLELAGPHVQVKRENTQTTARITRNYLEYVEAMVFHDNEDTASGATIDTGSGTTLESGSGSVLLSTLWEHAGSETGLVHPLYWTETDATLAEMNVYTHITKYVEYLETIVGYTGIPREQMVVVDSSLLDTQQQCGALFHTGSKEIHFGAGGCGEQAYSYSRDMIIHEYAHALMSMLYTPIYREYTIEQALLEGVADYLAASFTNDPIIGEYTLAQPRSLDNTQRVISYDEYGNIAEVFWSHNVHENGALIGGILWDIRKELGGILTDQLVIAAMAQQPRTLEELRIALLRADDDDSLTSNGTPHEATILGAFAKRGIIDHYTESDISGFAELGLTPLAPASISIEVEGYNGLYSNLHIQGKVEVSAVYQDHRTHMHGVALEIQHAQDTTFNNAQTLYHDAITPVQAGEQSDRILFESFPTNGFARLRFIDEDGRKGTWSTAIALAYTDTTRFPVSTLPERTLTDVTTNIQTISTTNPNELSVLSGSGILILDSRDLTTKETYVLGSDIEHPTQHLVSATHVTVFNKHFDSVLTIERTTGARYLFTSGDVFVKENDLWKRAIQTDPLPMHIQDIQITADTEHAYLVLTTKGGIHTYDLNTRTHTQRYTSTEAELVRSRINSTGDLFTLGTTLDTQQSILYVFNGFAAQEISVPTYFYCTTTCTAPEKFQQLPNIPAQDIQNILFADDEIILQTNSAVHILSNPYQETTLPYKGFSLENEEGYTHIPNLGSILKDTVTTEDSIVLLTGREIITISRQTGQVIAYRMLEEGDAPQSMHVLPAHTYYLAGATEAYLYASAIPARQEHNDSSNDTSTEEQSEEEQGGEEQTEQPSDEEENNEEGNTTGEESNNETEEETSENGEGTPENTISDEQKKQEEQLLQERIRLQASYEGGTVSLAWEDEDQEAGQQYHVYRANNEQVYSQSPRIAELTKAQQTHKDTVSAETGIYRYVIYTVDAQGIVLYRSNIVEIQTSSVPMAPTFVLPHANAVVFNKPVLQFASAYVANTDSIYHIEVASDVSFEHILVSYQSGDVRRQEYGFKIGQTQGSGAYLQGSEIKELTPGIYFVRARSIASGNVEGHWSETRQFIVDDLQVQVSSAQHISFDTAGRGESIISSGSTMISAETYVPSFSFKVFTDTPLRVQNDINAAIKSWDGEQGFGFAFRWSADNGQSWNYRRGDSEVEWFRIPENLSYYPIGSRTTPTQITLHSELQSLEKKQFLVELMFRVKTAEGDVGHYSTNVIVAPSKDMYGLFGE